MAAEVQIPTLGESVTEGVIVRWIRAEGEAVKSDEPLFELETDKANVEVPSPAAGVLRILRQEGETVQVGDVVARIEDGAAERRPGKDEVGKPEQRPEGAATHLGPETAASSDERAEAPALLSPAVRRLVEEHDLGPERIRGTGRGGRLTKADVLAHLEEAGVARGEDSRLAERPAPAPPARQRPEVSGEDERRVPMTRIRQRIAERLVEAQRTAAILTTFNEVDMSAVLELRTRYKESFAAVHGVRLGFVSFFARACIAALGDIPIVNAQIDGTDIVHRKRVHLGIAVGTERGLVVPVVHDADRMSFAELEREIERLAGRARQNRLAIEDLSGGTFTISNGGVYGSLLSTPILNPPQSAILGMHKVEKRPVVIDDAVVVRPMMYVALSYDHRLIDGAEAVTFLVRVKERIEDPARLLLEV